MKSFEAIYTQIKGLAYGLKECNYVPYDKRVDIIQDSVLKVLEKHKEGVLKDDAQEIRGYIFQIVRNNCIQEGMKKNKYCEINFEIVDDNKLVFEEDEDIQAQINLIKTYLPNRKFKDIHRDYFELLMEGVSHQQIIETLNLTNFQLGVIKRGLSRKMNTLLKKPVKYRIINTTTNQTVLSCHSFFEITEYLKQFSYPQIKNALEKNRTLNEYKIIKLKK